MPGGKVSIDVGDIILSILGYRRQQELLRRSQEETNLANAQRLSEAYGGLGEYAKQPGLSTADVMKVGEALFGRGFIPPQRTYFEQREVPIDGGFKTVTQPRTQQLWPPQTAAQMLEGGKQKYLTEQPEAMQNYYAATIGGQPTPWQQTQFNYQKAQDLANLASSSVIHKVNVIDAKNNMRPITGPEAMTYWKDVLEGNTPSLNIAPPATEADKWNMALRYSEMLTKLGLFGKDISTLDPISQNIVRSAETLEAAKVIDGVVHGPSEAAEGAEFETGEVGLEGEKVSKAFIYKRGAKKGQVEPYGVPWNRRAPSERAVGGFTQQQWGNEVDKMLVRSFMDVARKDYTEFLKSRGTSQQEIDNLTDVRNMIEQITVRDPLGGVTYNLEGLMRYMSPKNRQKLMAISAKARSQFDPNKIQNPADIVESLMPMEVTPKTWNEIIKSVTEKQQGVQQFTPSPQQPVPKPPEEEKKKKSIGRFKVTPVR